MEHAPEDGPGVPRSPRGPAGLEPDEAAEHFRQSLLAFAELATTRIEDLDAADWLELNAEIGRRLGELHSAGQVISRRLGEGAASGRLQRYLLAHLSTAVTNYELAGAAGVLEWARRVRELSREQGWEITTGPSDGLRVGEYRLDAEQLDLAEAERWRVRNEIRRQPGSGSDRCLAYLMAIFPEVASKEDMAYVARIQSWPRRMRELEEAGWAVVSSSDDPTLPAGSYKLDSKIQGPARMREAIARRRELLARDNWTCTMCGASPSYTPGTKLQIHHRWHVRHGGGNDNENLVTLCASCHAGEHSVREDAVRDELLEPSADPDRLAADE